MMKKKVKALFQFKNHIQTQPEILNYLAEVDLPQAHPMDSADTLRLKASIILESFFKDSTIPRDQYTWLDIAQSLAQEVRSGDIVTRDDLSLLLDQLQNPGSELFLKALALVMS